jgi:hypothetical protein
MFHALEGLEHPHYSPGLSPCEKAEKGRSSRGRRQNRDGATSPAAAQGVICGENPLGEALMGSLPQRPWELFYRPRSIRPEQSAETDLI